VEVEVEVERRRELPSSTPRRVPHTAHAPRFTLPAVSHIKMISPPEVARMRGLTMLLKMEPNR
jgi:hypothetical protein